MRTSYRITCDLRVDA